MNRRMRCGVLGNPEGYYVQDLLRAAAGRHDVTVFDFETLAVRLETGSCGSVDGSGELPEACDLMLVRTMPWGSLEQIVFRIDVLHHWQAQGLTVLNTPRCLEIAIDKFRTLSLLQQAGLPVPRTRVCQTVGQAVEAFEALGGDVVVKPLFGGEGRGLMRLEDGELASRAFKTLVQLNAVLYVQQFVPHDGWDLRVLWLGDRHWVIRRSHATDWRTNVSRGAIAEVIAAEPHWLDLSRRAAEVVEAAFAGVDLIIDREGKPWILEVNAVPGWKGVAQATGEDIATAVLSYLEQCATRESTVGLNAVAQVPFSACKTPHDVAGL